MRRKAAAIRAVQAGAEFGAPIDAAASPDDRARAILMQADRALREIGGELHRKAARQAIREGFDLLTDFAPIRQPVGEGGVNAHGDLLQEQRLIDVPGLKQDTAQKMLFRITRRRSGLGRNPNVEQVFDGVLPELTRSRRRKIRKKYRRMFGPAGEHHLVWLMNTAGDASARHTNRHFRADGIRFGADARSTYKYEVARKNRLAPNFRKPEGTIGEHKGGVGAHLTGPQGEAHSRMAEEFPAIAVTDDAIQAQHVMVARSDFHEYNLRQIKNIIVDDLGIGKNLNPKQIDRVMQNVTELHKASMPSRALKFGSVMAFVMISAAVMAADSDSRRGNGDALSGHTLRPMAAARRRAFSAAFPQFLSHSSHRRTARSSGSISHSGVPKSIFRRSRKSG